MTRPAAGKPHYRLHVCKFGEALIWWVGVVGGPHWAYGPALLSSAEAIRRAPR